MPTPFVPTLPPAARYQRRLPWVAMRRENVAAISHPMATVNNSQTIRRQPGTGQLRVVETMSFDDEAAIWATR